MKLELAQEPYTANRDPHPVLWGIVLASYRSKCYLKAYRRLEYVRDAGFYKTPTYLLVRHQKQHTGKQVWLCLDQSNGNPELGRSKSYVWIFTTKQGAERQRARHKRHGDAPLSRPFLYCIVDHIEGTKL